MRRREMTVEQLIAALRTVDQDATIWIASDAEGNEFSPLDGPFLAEEGEVDGSTSCSPVVVLYPKHGIC